jgi:hypothetical protein
MPKYYVAKDVDLKLFTLNLDNIPQGYHTTIDYRQCSGPPLSLNQLKAQFEANDWACKIVDIMKEQFGMKQKEQTDM